MGRRGPRQQFTDIACPNRECPKYGQAGKGNIVGNGTYTVGGIKVRKFLCKACGRTFNSRTGTIYEGIRSDSSKMDEAVECLHEGMSVKEAAAKVDASPATVRRWYSNITSFAQVPRMFESSKNIEKIDDMFSEIVRNIDFSQVPIALMYMQEKLTRLVRICMMQILGEIGIRPYHVVFILEVGSHPRITQKALTDLLPMDRSRVSIVMKELISMGFIEKTGENKGSVLSLTPRGEEADGICRSSWKKVFQEVFGELSEHQRCEIQESLTLLNSKLDEVALRMLREQQMSGKDDCGSGIRIEQIKPVNLS